MPICRRGGCSIHDLATDPAVNKFIDRYRLARTLYDVNQIEAMLLAEFKALGLTEDQEFLLELEYIYAQAKSFKQKEQNGIRMHSR